MIDYIMIARSHFSPPTSRGTGAVLVLVRTPKTFRNRNRTHCKNRPDDGIGDDEVAERRSTTSYSFSFVPYK